MSAASLDFEDAGVVVRPCYLLAGREEDGRPVNIFRARYFRRGDDGQLVRMTDPEVGAFLIEHPEVPRLLLEHRAVSAELRADHAEHRLREAQRRLAEFEGEAAVA